MTDVSGATTDRARRGAVDVARVAALVIVVLGHLLLAVIDRDASGAIRGDNLLALRPSWAWLAALAPMPVFFTAGGWANATATASRAAGRLRTLVGLAAVVTAVWSALVIGVTVATGSAGLTGDGARIATQPLWFLAAYVPFAAAGGPLARGAAKRPVLVVGGCIALVAAIDVARFGLGAPKWIAWPGFPLVWAVPWLLGAWWRDRWVARAPADARWFERRAGAALALGGIAGCFALVAIAGYSPMLIDAIPGRRSNTTPPTLYTAIAALAQSGVLLVGAATLDGLARRARRAVDAAGEAAVGIYVWHLTALSLCVAAVAAGAPAPTRLTGSWWATRPLWFALVLAVTGGLVGATAAVRARLGRKARPRRGPAGEPAPPPTAAVVVAVLVTAATAGAIGLHGPRTAPWAIVLTAGFLGGWLLLRARPART